MKSFTMTFLKTLPKVFAAGSLLLFVASGFAADTARKNGEFINCKSIASKAEISCNFMLSGAAPVIEVALNFSGDAKKTHFKEYPAQGESTALLMLVDVSDPKRAKAVAAAAGLIRQVVDNKKPHQQIAIAQFDSAVQLLADFNSDAATTREFSSFPGMNEMDLPLINIRLDFHCVPSDLRRRQ